MNQFIDHVLSDQLNPYHYVKESGSANQPNEQDVGKVVSVSKKRTLIKSTVEKPQKHRGR